MAGLVNAEVGHDVAPTLVVVNAYYDADFLAIGRAESQEARCAALFNYNTSW